MPPSAPSIDGLTPDENAAIAHLDRIIITKADVRLQQPDGYPYELQANSFVWYKYIDGRWFPAKVASSVKKGNYPHKWWWGLLGCPDPDKPRALWHVVLCPNEGNVLPDNQFAAKILQVFKRLPRDYKEVDHIMNTFKANVDKIGRNPPA